MLCSFSCLDGKQWLYVIEMWDEAASVHVLWAWSTEKGKQKNLVWDQTRESACETAASEVRVNIAVRNWSSCFVHLKEHWIALLWAWSTEKGKQKNLIWDSNSKRESSRETAASEVRVNITHVSNLSPFCCSFKEHWIARVVTTVTDKQNTVSLTDSHLGFKQVAQHDPSARWAGQN